MTFSVHGLPVARGIAIGRAVLIASSRADVAHYFIEPSQIESEIERVRAGRNAVIDELHRLQHSLEGMSPKETPHELRAFCARLLGVPANKVRVIMRDTGGGFGQKARRPAAGSFGR